MPLVQMPAPPRPAIVELQAINEEQNAVLILRANYEERFLNFLRKYGADELIGVREVRLEGEDIVIVMRRT